MYASVDIHARRQFGVFTAAQARAAGYAIEEIQSLVRRGRWCRIRRGVYMDAAHHDGLAGCSRELHLVQCAAVRLALRRGFVLSHWSAVRFHRLDVLSPLPADVFGTDPHQARSGPGYRVCGSVLPLEHVQLVDGWQLTRPARTVVDVARSSSFKAGVVLADSALRQGLAARSELSAVALACSHYEGIGQAARACSFARRGAESVLESTSRVDLMSQGLPEPTLQVPFYDRSGFIGRVDMFWRGLGVVGEADGRIKYTKPYPGVASDEVLWAEKLRMERLQAAGVEVVRWTAAEINASPGDVARRILTAADRARLLTPRYRLGPHDDVVALAG